jgi:uncharacterized protein (DUF488 family)
MAKIWTLGHSTRPIAEALRAAGIDYATFPQLGAAIVDGKLSYAARQGETGV